MKTSTLVIGTALLGVAGYFAFAYLTRDDAPVKLKSPASDLTPATKPTSASSSASSAPTLGGKPAPSSPSSPARTPRLGVVLELLGVKTAPTLDGDVAAARVADDFRF